MNVRTRIVKLAAAATLSATIVGFGASAAYAGDPSQWGRARAEVAGDPSQWVSAERKVNEYEGQKVNEYEGQKVNEYEGQHR